MNKPKVINSTLTLPKKLNDDLRALSKKKGQTKSFYIVSIIQDHLSDRTRKGDE